MTQLFYMAQQNKQMLLSIFAKNTNLLFKGVPLIKVGALIINSSGVLIHVSSSNLGIGMIRNFITCEKISDENSHGGEGVIEIQKMFKREDFSGAWDFALRVVMPPNSSMGLHQHGNDEEMYIILSGEGLMTIEGKEQRVAKGDMILNQPFGNHGLLNDSKQDIELLIIQASNKG